MCIVGRYRYRYRYRSNTAAAAFAWRQLILIEKVIKTAIKSKYKN